MCVAAIAWHMDPRWPLLVIGNRDEYHARASAPLARWEDGSGIIAGRDLIGGGTWLGIMPDAARFALVTNVRNPDGPNPAKASRGALVVDMLTGTGPYADPAEDALDNFNPFNLLLAGGDTLHFLTNRPAPRRTILPPGIYGLSNGALDEPWPKTLALKAALADWLDAGEGDTAELFAALTAKHVPGTGIGPLAPDVLPADPRDTAPFIRHPIYGTRCATVLAVDGAGHGLIAERRFDAGGGAIGETTIPFDWG